MRLIPLEGRERIVFAGLMSIALAQSLAVMVPAWIVKVLFDRMGGHHRHPTTLTTATLIMFFLAMALTIAAMEIGKRRLGAEMALRHAASIRQKLFQCQITAAALRTRNQGSLLLPFVGDLSASRRWVGEGLVRGGSSTVLIPIVIGVIAMRSGVMAAALGLVLLLSLAGSVLMVSPLDDAVREVRKRRGALTSFVSGRIAAAATIHVSGRVSHELAKVRARTDKLSNAERRRAWAVGATRGIGQFTNSLLVLSTMLVGLEEVANGHASAGEIAAVLTLVGLLGAGVTDLARAFEAWRPAKVAYERIDRVLASSPSKFYSGNRLERRAAGLILERFGVPHCVQAVSAALPPGSVALLDGSAGTGKSALLRSIAQLRNYSGTVWAEGQQLQSLSERTRSKKVGFASVELPILPGSIGMNLRYRASDIADDELLALAKDCGLSALIDRLHGLNGRIAENTELSAGEHQGLALARALAGSPALLLLDSVDTHLDGPVCLWLAQRIQSYRGSVLMVASRAELRAAADIRWILQDGRMTTASVAAVSNIVTFKNRLP